MYSGFNFSHFPLRSLGSHFESRSFRTIPSSLISPVVERKLSSAGYHKMGTNWLKEYKLIQVYMNAMHISTNNNSKEEEKWEREKRRRGK